MHNEQKSVHEAEAINHHDHHGHHGDDAACRKSHHPDKVKKDMITRLNRVEGQIRGIKGMIEKDVYCDDVITQLAATQSALNSVAKILLEGHIKGCVVDRLGEGDEAVLDELLITIQKLMKK
ncbi:metal-sensitive transcriptional regulator [Paenibacillus septentrionalis]|uniref:Metal-sensitive transcriptional regulator n=1 Tax=Paenibacillus septentrionalis TaxID=429342 RepID=A0ABW1V3S7_9BACL